MSNLKCRGYAHERSSGVNSEQLVSDEGIGVDKWHEIRLTSFRGFQDIGTAPGRIKRMMDAEV